MLNQLKKYILENDKKFILYKHFYEEICEILEFDYSDMLFTGDSKDILDFSKSSMFYWNDPIERIVQHTKRKNCIPLTENEKILLKNTDELIIECNNEELKTLNISDFSGLTAAKDIDWGTLENYGNSLLPRKEWSKNQSNYHGFETDEDYNKLLKIFKEEPSHIKGAIHNSWVNRYYFLNSGVSHRLAALYRQDTTQNKKTKVDLLLTEKTLNIDCGKIIYENYIGIITTGMTYLFFANIFKSINQRILLEEQNIHKKDNNLYILWIEKSEKDLVNRFIKVIKLLPLNNCYVITDALKKYIKS